MSILYYNGINEEEALWGKLNVATIINDGNKKQCCAKRP